MNTVPAAHSLTPFCDLYVVAIRALKPVGWSETNMSIVWRDDMDIFDSIYSG